MCACVRECVCVRVHMLACMHVCVYVHAHACLCMRVCLCLCYCVCVSLRVTVRASVRLKKHESQCSLECKAYFNQHALLQVFLQFSFHLNTSLLIY